MSPPRGCQSVPPERYGLGAPAPSSKRVRVYWANGLTCGEGWLGQATDRTTVEIDVGDAAVGTLVDAVLRQTTLRDLIIDDPPLDDVIRSQRPTPD